MTRKIVTRSHILNRGNVHREGAQVAFFFFHRSYTTNDMTSSGIVVGEKKNGKTTESVTFQ